MKIPVILDTDIGSDIDDTWALAMLLKSPELDLRLITTSSFDTRERAKIAAKMLTIAGRTDVPVGIGIRQNEDPLSISEWVKNYDLESYAGTVYEDGVEAMCETILKSPEPITVIGIGPLTNIKEALSRAPEIAKHVRFVGMQGSIYRGYQNAQIPSKEYNIVVDIEAAKQVFSASWREAVITPLDTCGVIRLEGEKYESICKCKDPLIQAVIESYQVWLKKKEIDACGRSSVLFDTVAIYLAFTTDLLKMKSLKVRVTEDGYTVPDETGGLFNCALEWNNLSKFQDFLVQRLTQADN